MDKNLTLGEVKEHFKYAKEVRCARDGSVYDLNRATEKGIYKQFGSFWFDDSKKISCALFDVSNNQLATIVSYIFERGEEVEVSDNGEKWYPSEINYKFLTFTLDGLPVVQTPNGNASVYKHIRKLSLQTQLQTEITALETKAKELGIKVTFEILK